MSQVIVVNNSLKISNNLCDILEKRDITVIKAGIGSSKPDFMGIDLVGYQADTIVCSDIFEKEIGGSSNLVAIARQAKLNKIIIIADDENCNSIEIKEELGGSLKRIKIADYKDQYSLELIFNTCCPNISFSGLCCSGGRTFGDATSLDSQSCWLDTAMSPESRRGSR